MSVCYNVELEVVILALTFFYGIFLIIKNCFL